LVALRTLTPSSAVAAIMVAVAATIVAGAGIAVAVGAIAGAVVGAVVGAMTAGAVAGAVAGAGVTDTSTARGGSGVAPRMLSYTRHSPGEKRESSHNGWSHVNYDIIDNSNKLNEFSPNTK
jgi:integral membrane sensor domain MASE1